MIAKSQRAVCENGKNPRQQLDCQRRDLGTGVPPARHLLHPIDLHHHALPLRLDGHPPEYPGARQAVAANMAQVRLDDSGLSRARASMSQLPRRLGKAVADGRLGCVCCVSTVCNCEETHKCNEKIAELAES